MDEFSLGALLSDLPWQVWVGVGGTLVVLAGAWMLSRRGGGAATADEHFDDVIVEASDEAEEHEEAADDAADGRPDPGRVDDLLEPPSD